MPRFPISNSLIRIADDPALIRNAVRSMQKPCYCDRCAAVKVSLVQSDLTVPPSIVNQAQIYSSLNLQLRIISYIIHSGGTVNINGYCMPNEVSLFDQIGAPVSSEKPFDVNGDWRDGEPLFEHRELS